MEHSRWQEAFGRCAHWARMTYRKLCENELPFERERAYLKSENKILKDHVRNYRRQLGVAFPVLDDTTDESDREEELRRVRLGPDGQDAEDAERAAQAQRDTLRIEAPKEE